MNKIYTVLVLILFALNGFTQNVSVDKAKTVAINWYRHYAPLDKQQGNILKSKEYKHKDATNFYIFSFDKGGFVIVSANDQVDPILGYGFEGYIPDSIANPAVKDWFENYARQIDTIGKLNLKSAKVNPKWYLLTNNIFLKAGTLSVSPLLTTTWNQGCYYDALCPADVAGQCGHVWTGCVATSTAQIMKYWSYPIQGTGSHTYSYAPYGSLSANFGTTTYNWSNMPNNIIADNLDIATLMFHCGVAVDMMYAPAGSSAFDPRLALINYFNYSPNAQFVNKISYTDIAWEALMKTEIDAFRPIWYEGFGLAGGHAFVCDGYQSTNYFHFNWGWGGAYDGYFLLASLNPGSYTFNNSQAAIINIYPANGAIKYTVTEPATSIGTTTAILHSIVQPNGLSTTVSFEYGTTTSYGSTIASPTSPVSGNINVYADANISGLLPTTNYHFRVKIINANGTFYGTDYTLLTKSDIWIAQTSGTPNNLNSVSFVSSNIGYVVGDGGTILKTIDGGITWISLNSNYINNFKGVYFLNVNTGWAVGYNGIILKTIDGGTTWILETSGTISNLYSVFFIDANNGWVGSDGKVLNTTDGGLNWSSLNIGNGGPFPVYSLFFPSPILGYAAGWYTDMLYTDNSIIGGNWYGIITAPASNGFYGVHFPSPGNGFSCGSLGAIYKMNSTNSTWNRLVSSTTSDLKSIFFTDNNNGFIVGVGGIILNTINGTDWINSPSGISTDLNSVCFSDVNNGWVAGNNGVILHTTKGKIVSDINLKLSVFLEGAYNGAGAMKTTLNTTPQLIPLAQPYNVSPFNYTGLESVNAIPAGVVDWVLVEVRQAASPILATLSTILTKRAGFLKMDGTIVDLDGVSSLSIGRPTIISNLYIVVRHRNHLAIMSAVGATLNGLTYDFDFTTASTQAYGGLAGYKQLATGLCGMVSGDVDSDGTITVLDFSKWASEFGKTSVYTNSDIDLDGTITVLDFSKWALNFGAAITPQLKSQGVQSAGSKYISQVPDN